MSKSYRVETTQQVVIGFVHQKGVQNVNGLTFRAIDERVISDPTSEAAAKRLAKEEGYHLVGASYPHPLIDPAGDEMFDDDGNPITALTHDTATQAFIKGLKEPTETDDISSRIQQLQDELDIKNSDLEQLKAFTATLKAENAQLKKRVAELEASAGGLPGEVNPPAENPPTAPAAAASPTLAENPTAPTQDSNTNGGTGPTIEVDNSDLPEKEIDELRLLAESLDIEVRPNYNKPTLIGLIEKARAAVTN